MFRDLTRSVIDRTIGRAAAYIAGLVLIAAAILKSLWPVDAGLETVYALPSWLTAMAVQVELAIGLWLWSGRQARTARTVAGILFAVFGILSLIRAIAGHESCGCFGAMSVNPKWTFLLDAAMVICLAFTPVDHSRRFLSLSPLRTACVMCSYFVCAAFVLSSSLLLQRSRAEIPGVLVTSDLIILDPSEWIDRPFPLKKFFGPTIDLERGEWTVLIYHHDCPQCQKALPMYNALANQLASSGSSHRILLVESPPYGDEARSGGMSAVHVRLTDREEWFVQTPVEIHVRNGRVSTVSRELPAIAN